MEILSKSKLERCEKSSVSDTNLNCTWKIVINMAIPSGSSGGEASIVAEIVEVEENSSSSMQTLRIPPVITVNKSAAYAMYELTYIRDVAYKPQEYSVKTRKCEPDAGDKVVQICERRKCSGFFDFSCHIQYICMSWMVMFGILLAIFPAVAVLLWLLHQKGFFDPLYDWWDDKHGIRDIRGYKTEHVNKHHKKGAKHHTHGAQHKRRSIHHEHRHYHSVRDADYSYYLQHVHKDRTKHRTGKIAISAQHVHLDGMENDNVGHHR